jgi:hypothetical protein
MMNRRIAALLLTVVWAATVSLAGAAQRVIYETRFEVSEGYDPELTLIGQNGWVGEGSGANGLVTNFFAGEAQHAFIGFSAPTNSTVLNAWRPVNYLPGGTNPPQVRFSVLMSIEDSASTTNRDDFRWSFYNGRADRLFTLDFDNNSLGINYLLDDNAFVATGVTFSNSVNYELEVRIDFVQNRWSALLNGQGVVSNLQVTTRNVPLDLGDVDAVWAIRTEGKPGDNFMVFDNYRITVESNVPPRLEALDWSPRLGFILQWSGVPGVRYLLEGSSDFEVWHPVVTNTMGADGFIRQNDNTGGGLRFYRVQER